MLRGIDLSEHQATTPPLDGLAFIVLRASIGLRKDAKYDQHATHARAAGLVFMAYHFGTQDPIDQQVETFLGAAGSADFLWIDEEQGFTDAQAQQFVDAVRATGRPIGLYHSASGFGGVNADANWVADWRSSSVLAGHPQNGAGTAEFSGWDLWQYQGSPLDSDYLNPASPLSGLLRRGYVTVALHEAELREATDPLKAQIAVLDADNATLTTENLELAAKLAQAEADKAVLQADLTAAPAIERGRIAAAEAARINSL